MRGACGWPSRPSRRDGKSPSMRGGTEGLPPVEQREGYRLVRTPRDWRYHRSWARASRSGGAIGRRWLGSGHRRRRSRSATPPRGSRLPRLGHSNGGIGGSAIREFPCNRWAGRSRSRMWPNRLTSGMACGQARCRLWLRMRRRHGGPTIYDSRDIFMRSGKLARLGRPGRDLLGIGGAAMGTRAPGDDDERVLRGPDRRATPGSPGPAIVMNTRPRGGRRLPRTGPHP